jgi:hypothetical protein
MTQSKADAEDSAGPLNEAWWEDAREADDWMPADDVPLLGPYDQTQPGFEVVLGSGPGDQSIGDGHCRLCLWDIWEKKKDPAEADPQKQKINEMQRALGRLDDDTRLVRIQMACLTRCFYTFPVNVDLVLDGIASGQPRLDAEMSCEPPWVGLRLILLRRRDRSTGGSAPDQQGLDPLEDQRDSQIRAYATILTWWSAAGSLDCLKAELPAHADLAETIYRRLGEPTKLKWLYVQKLCANLNRWGMPGLAWERWVEMGAELGNAYDAAIQQALGGQEDRISRLIDRNNDVGSCHHAFFRHVDHIIAHIGAGRPVTLPGAGQEGKRIRDTVTNYVHALGSWVAGRKLKETIEIWPACEDVATRAYDMLGKAAPVKRWLVASLWRKLQDHEVKHGRGALDDQPERFAIPSDALSP